MKFELFERVVLNRDLPEHELCAGDVGTVVEPLPPDGFAVEFMEASGDTRAVLMLRESDVRQIRPCEMLAVRGP